MKQVKITFKMNPIRIHIHAFLLMALFMFAGHIKAQTGKYEIKEEEYNNSNELFYFRPYPSWNKTTIEKLPAILGGIYGISSNFTFKPVSVIEDEFGRTVKVIQAYNDIEVEGGEIILKYNNNGVLQHVIGTLRKVNHFQKAPALNNEEALEIAYKASNTSKFQLDINPEDGTRYEPVIKLMYIPKAGEIISEYVLGYEVELVLINPDRLYYYINAITGEIENSYSAIHHVNGTGNSLYAGTVGYTTTQIGNTYYLRDPVRKINCYNHLLQRAWFDPAFINDVTAAKNLRRDSFPDLNNNWGTGDQKAAADVHWGMTKVYDYYKNKHNRISYDGNGSPINNRVHYDDITWPAQNYPITTYTIDSLWNNATWNGRNMSFGDGDGVQFSPLVSLDIAGHEFTHAVVEHTAGLKYQGESGALNESFADIFGTCIEFYAYPSVGKTANYEIGEECYTPSPGPANDNLRDLSEPNNSDGGAQPNTYEGNSWNPTTPTTKANDFGGVHTNSGVGNYWFYLLCEGASNKTNDKGHKYSVTKIGMDKAQKIAYRALTLYMTSNSDYKAARKATLLAAEDIYNGKKSAEYKQVCNAWYAVNVGERCCGGDSLQLEFAIKDAKCHDSKDGEIKLTLKNTLGPPFEFKWYKGSRGSAVISTSKDLTGLDTGTYVVWVRDTISKCETVGDTMIKSPEKVKAYIFGGGTNYFRPCDGAPKITLSAIGIGGKPPYTYSWPGAQKIVSSSGRYDVEVKDKNLCKGTAFTIVRLVPLVCSRDPNDIIGPINFGPKKFISKFATHQYKVRFENDPDFATASASRVTVDLPLDNNMDMNTFRVSSFGFNNWTFTVPANLSTYYKRLDLRDTMGIFLDVTAGLDQGAKKAFWIFESIDPATGLPPTVGALGFLPVNDSILHNGEGFVDFNIRAKTSTVTGDSIRAQAEIVFDDNSSIFTPKVHNIIDAKPPVSVMDSMPSIIDSTQFTLRFRAKDDVGGSGYGSTDLMVSENNGAYTPYQKNIQDTFVSFSGNSGSFYQFYTQASDNVANKETAKVNPEVSLTITPKNFLFPIDSTLSFCTTDSLDIKWKKVPITGFDLQYVTDSGQFSTFAYGLGGADTIYHWKIPFISASSVKIKIRAVSSSTALPLDETSFFTVHPIPNIYLGRDTFYCDGSTISIVLDAGSGFSSYLWNNSSTSQTLSVDSAGTYSVAVTNTFGCITNDEVLVSKAFNPVISSKTVKNISCSGMTNGEIQIVTVSGTQPYQFLWNNSDTLEDLTKLTAGTYTLLVTDKKGCTVQDTATIIEPPQLMLSYNITHVKCKNGNDGNIDLNVTGGSSPYYFLWSNNATTEDITTLVADTFSIRVTDANSCIAIDTMFITEPALLVSSKTKSDVKCKNGNDGSIDLSVNGGTTPYTYLWSNSATTQDVSALAAGTYSVIITDANACTRADTVIITEPTLLTKSKSSLNVKCKNGNDGSIDLTVSGGTTPYAYMWSDSSTTQDISGLTAGTYSVFITDANACSLKDTIIITEPTLLSLTKSILNVKCKNGNDGSIDLTVNGGTTPYTYLWSNAATTQDITTLTAGTYNVRVTDANNCIVRDTTVITEPTLLVSSKTSANVKCKNGNDGSINLTVSGGVTPYTYLWSNSATSEDISTLTAGTYTVRITDANSCIRRDTVIITEPALLVSSKTKADVKCKNGNDGSINLTVSGGVTPYTFLWSNSATTEDISTLTAGTYTVLITDANACIRRDTVVITEPNLLTKSKTFQNVKCKNGNDGSIDLTVNGGTTPYTYLWSNAATTQDITTLTAGTYNVRVTDANNCIVRDTTVITEPTLLVSSKTSVNVKCKNGNDGSINLTVSGGITPYTYLWSNSATSEDISTLTAGTYTVRITDANSCIRRDTVIITEPALLVSSKTKADVKCKNGNDGSINLTVSGGVTPYTFLWSNSATTEDISTLTAGTYTVLITDANACIRRDTVVITEPNLLTKSKTFQNVKCKNGNDGSIDLTVNGGTTPYTYLWSNAATTQDITTLTAGTYNVRVTDANNCIVRDTTVITEPTLLVSSKTSVNVKCKNGNDGSINLTVSGGITPYTYLWSNSATSEDISTLTASTYTVRVTDANSCIRRDTVIITEPTLLVSSKTKSDVKCKNGNDGSINLTVSGGVTPYTFLWSNSATSEDISTLIAGTYTVLITDANACIRRDTVVITEPNLLTKSKTFQNVKCKNGNDGSIDLTVNGGTTPYTYLWSNAATTQDITTLTAGTYNVRVTDANNCIVRDTTVITEPTLLVSSKTSVNVKCKNGNDGSINLTVSGGVTPYTYLWSNSAITQDIGSLKIGTYSVRITDANGCIRRDTAIISEPTLLMSNITINDVLCYGGSDGAITASAFGGVSPYTYAWQTGESTATINNKSKGTYIVQITDNNLCLRKDTIIISQPAAPLSLTSTIADVQCHSGSDGGIDLNITGGTTPYTYLWDNGRLTEDLNNEMQGTYSIVITDKNNCLLRDTFMITQPLAPLSFSQFILDVKCHNGSDGAIDLNVAGGTAPYTYLWNNAANTEDISGLVTGRYSFIVTDKNNCLLKDSMLVKQPVAPLSSTLTENKVNCFGGTDGSILTTIVGGTIPYTYKWSNGATTMNINGIPQGKYNLEVTDSNNCILLDSITITQPAAPLSAALTVDDVDCYGDNSGAISLSPNGGTPPYTYLWSNSVSNQNISNLFKGTYSVTVNDKNNCIYKDSAFVPEPSELKVESFANSATRNASNGSAWVSASGGTLPYTYEWNDPGSQATDSAQNLSVGDYIVTVTDAKGCSKSDTIFIPDAPDPSTISLFPNPNNGYVKIINLASLGLDESIKIEVYDMTGKACMDFEVIGTDIYEFVLTDTIRSGTYLVKVSNSRGTQSRRLILLR